MPKRAKKKVKKPARKPAKKAVAVAVPPAGRFRALKTFHSDDTASDYVAGLTYTVRPGNERLERLMARWQSESKVEAVEEKVHAAAAGRGTVK